MRLLRVSFLFFLPLLAFAGVATLTSLLEPALMVFLGVVIGFIVIAMYLPIFKMAAAIG